MFIFDLLLDFKETPGFFLLVKVDYDTLSENQPDLKQKQRFFDFN